MAEPMTDEQLEAIRSDLDLGYRPTAHEARALLAEVERLRALQGRVDYEKVGADRERKVLATWLRGPAGKYLSKGRDGVALADAVERGEHHQ